MYMVLGVHRRTTNSSPTRLSSHILETLFGSYASLLIQATDQRRSKKLFGLRSTSARFQRKCFFPLSANLRKIQDMNQFAMGQVFCWSAHVMCLGISPLPIQASRIGFASSPTSP